MSTASSELRFEGGGRASALHVRRSRRARAMRLSVDMHDGRVKLVLPFRASLRDGLTFADQQRAWVEARLAALPETMPIAPGAEVRCGDAVLTIDWDPARPRAPRRDGASLRVGGPRETLAPRVLRWLKREALTLLEAETRALALWAGVSVGRVGVGDPRRRWGSCAAGGDIRYSWRLVLAPPFVRRATVAHEVAHRVHMHHGSAFHALAAALNGEDPAPARHWLRAHGASLHWFGRGS